MPPSPPVIHCDALVETDAVGAGTRIWRNAHVLKGAVIGEECNIGEGCYIEGFVRIGNRVTVKNNIALWDNISIEDDVFLGPAAVFTNDHRPRAFNKKTHNDLTATIIQRGATIGANATIVCGVTIGVYAFVGAGAVVTKDVAPYTLVYGNPAVFKGFICKCSASLPPRDGTHQCACGMHYIIRNNTVTIQE